jgi:hypothetical protein
MNIVNPREHLSCPVCQHSTGMFLAETSIATGQQHYKCFACAHMWIVEERPTPPAITSTPADSSSVTTKSRH